MKKVQQLRMELETNGLNFNEPMNSKSENIDELLKLVSGGYSNGKEGDGFIKAMFQKGRSIIE